MDVQLSHVPAYSGRVFVAHPPGYSPEPWFIRARKVIKGYCETCTTPGTDHPPGLCVTFALTTFVHKDAVEYGFVIGLVNYPRFPKDGVGIRRHALELAKVLMAELEQDTALIDFPDLTTWVKRRERTDNGQDGVLQPDVPKTTGAEQEQVPGVLGGQPPVLPGEEEV